MDTGAYPPGGARRCSAWGVSGGRRSRFWQTPGVVSATVGYAGGTTPNPTYREVCSGTTGHAEVVLVEFDPSRVSYADAAEGVLGEPRSDAGDAPGRRHRHAVPLGHLHVRRRGRPQLARASRDAYQRSLTAAGHGTITTEIAPAPPFYAAEEYHQRYLEKNPDGYCGLGGTGVSCPSQL